MKRTIMVVLALMVYLIVGGTSAYAQEPIKITAEELHDEYSANEIAADQKYMGKVLEVSGEIENFGKNSMGRPYMTLKGGGILSSVWCYFGASWESDLVKLEKGQYVIVQGICVGKTMLIDPSLDNCKLISVQSPPSPEPAEEDGGCFIATAAYGTATAQEINILRKFRDEILLPSSLGGEFVSLYYKYSPPIANYISEHEVLRTIVRVGFVDPIVAILKLLARL